MTDTTTNTAPAKEPEQLVTGYQWGADFSYIGMYQFPDNMDREPVHLPPNTTLQAPPAGLAAGKEAAFDTTAGAWVVRDEDLSWMDAESRARLLAAQAAEVQP
ncbi:hypothetical protein [Rhodoferax sp. WC2427]|uniref:hypothetical protein n=1 Tax=Rhodoferax sp. WC2427 TaxID=3234144 RepID=UPI0034662E3D